jgi:hypothetical protein
MEWLAQAHCLAAPKWSSATDFIKLMKGGRFKEAARGSNTRTHTGSATLGSFSDSLHTDAALGALATLGTFVTT